jgi:CRISPR-associated endoribonuclease Cas6
MRLKLSLSAKNSIVLPFNYQHFLTAVIYKTISRASSEHADWLHDKGYGKGTGLFKHFTFSKLMSTPKPEIKNGCIRFPFDSTWFISIHTPKTLEHFIVGLFEKQEFWLESPEKILRIVTVETMPEPVFTEQMAFTTLSPVLVKHPKSDSKLPPDFIFPDHPNFGQILTKNLINKYVSLNGGNAESFEMSRPFECAPDWGYVKRRGGIQKITKLISLYEGKPEMTQNRAFECPLQLTGDVRLIRTAYESGLGHENAMGFGMIETINS